MQSLGLEHRGAFVRGLAVMLVLVVVAAQAGAEQAVPAGRFVDSVGINIHLHYTRTPYYTDFPLVKRSLLQLHVRHIRDGLEESWPPVFYQRFNELGRAGIKGNFITSVRQTPDVLASFPDLVKDSFESYEGPNELNQSNDPAWSEKLRNFLPVLYRTAHRDGSREYPVIGPSITQQEAYSILGDISAYEDYANLHNYPAGRNPGTHGWGNHGYGSVSWNLGLAKITSASRPVITTESGYRNDAANSSSVPESVSAHYLPRLLMEQFQAGIYRTYLYELISSGTEDFGLLRADGSPKPGFAAVANTMQLLDDPSLAAQPGNLDISLSGSMADVGHLLLQKRDQTFYLALWIERPIYDVDKHAILTVAPQPIQVHLPWTPRRLIQHSLAEDGSMESHSLPGTPSVKLAVTDLLTILEISH